MKRFFRMLGGLAALSFLAAVMSCGGGVSPQSPSNEALTLETAKSLVTISYTGSDKADHVTQKVTLTATLKKGNETLPKAFDLQVIGTVSEELRQIIGKVPPPKGAIFGSDTSLTLSTTESGIPITWKSEHPEIIKIDESNTVTVTLPASKTAVVLTATAKKDGISESRKFTVTVHPAGSAPTAQDLLASIDFTAKKVLAGEQLPLPSAITGVSGTQITWTSDKPQSLTVYNGSSPKKATALPDLRDITVKLTATLEYNSQTASKTFDVTVERITEAKGLHDSNATYTFTDTAIIHTSSNGTHTNGAQWAYTLDKEKRQITAYKSHLLSDDGRWIAIGSAEHKQLLTSFMEKYLTQKINKVTALKILSEKDPVTLRDCGQALGLDSSLPEEELYKELQKRGFIDPYQKYDDFKALSDEQKSATIKPMVDAYVNRHKKKHIDRYKLPENADWASILNAANTNAQQERDNFEKEFQAWVSAVKTPYVCAYRFHPAGSGSYAFETSVVYDNTKSWFKQEGWYSNNSGSDEIALYLEKLPTVGFRCERQVYKGTLNSEGTEFKGKDSNGQEITCNITDKKDGTLSVSIAGTSKNYTLNFRGNSLR